MLCKGRGDRAWNWLVTWCYLHRAAARTPCSCLVSLPPPRLAPSHQPSLKTNLFLFLQSSLKKADQGWIFWISSMNSCCQCIWGRSHSLTVTSRSVAVRNPSLKSVKDLLKLSSREELDRLVEARSLAKSSSAWDCWSVRQPLPRG